MAKTALLSYKKMLHKFANMKFDTNDASQEVKDRLQPNLVVIPSVPNKLCPLMAG